VAIACVIACIDNKLRRMMRRGAAQNTDSLFNKTITDKRNHGEIPNRYSGVCVRVFEYALVYIMWNVQDITKTCEQKQWKIEIFLGSIASHCVCRETKQNKTSVEPRCIRLRYDAYRTVRYGTARDVMADWAYVPLMFSTRRSPPWTGEQCC